MQTDLKPLLLSVKEVTILDNTIRETRRIKGHENLYTWWRQRENGTDRR